MTGATADEIARDVVLDLEASGVLEYQMRALCKDAGIDPDEIRAYGSEVSA